MKLTDLERKQLETHRSLLGNALAEQAYMKIVMQGLKKLFKQAGRSDITDCNQEHHPYEFEMTTCDSLMKLYDMNHMNTCALIDAYEKVLKEDDAERAKEEIETTRYCSECKYFTAPAGCFYASTIAHIESPAAAMTCGGFARKET